jgi:hypothetical protein
MPKFCLREDVVYQVEAENGRAAIRRFLDAENTNQFFVQVNERSIEDESGQVLDDVDVDGNEEV